MNFEKLVAFWKLKGNRIRHESCITRDLIFQTDRYHVTYSMTVGDGNMHANILYRFETEDGVDSKFAMIYADLIFSGFPDHDGPSAAVFIKNAKLTDLIEHIK